MLQVLHKGSAGCGAAANLDFYAMRRIEYPTGEGVLLSQQINRGAEADALHNAGDLNTLVDAAYSLAASALAGIWAFSQSIQAGMPSPVLQETSKICSPGLSISTPCLK